MSGTVKVGDQIVVIPPDRRAYYGRLVEIRGEEDNAQAVVRLDTGWVTSYPLHMVHPTGRSSTVRADDRDTE